jgi:hypothetical protein
VPGPADYSPYLAGSRRPASFSKAERYPASHYEVSASRWVQLLLQECVSMHKAAAGMQSTTVPCLAHQQHGCHALYQSGCTCELLDAIGSDVLPGAMQRPSAALLQLLLAKPLHGRHDTHSSNATIIHSMLCHALVLHQ